MFSFSCLFICFVFIFVCFVILFIFIHIIIVYLEKMTFCKTTLILEKIYKTI